MAERTTTQKAPEEGPQQAETAKREVIDITGNVVRAPELRYTPAALPHDRAFWCTAGRGRHASSWPLTRQPFQEHNSTWPETKSRSLRRPGMAPRSRSNRSSRITIAAPRSLGQARWYSLVSYSVRHVTSASAGPTSSSSTKCAPGRRPRVTISQGIGLSSGVCMPRPWRASPAATTSESYPTIGQL